MGSHRYELNIIGLSGAAKCVYCGAKASVQIRVARVTMDPGHSMDCDEVTQNTMEKDNETKLLTNLYAQREKLRNRLTEFITLQRQNVREYNQRLISDYHTLMKHTEADIEFLNRQIKLISS